MLLLKNRWGLSVDKQTHRSLYDDVINYPFPNSMQVWLIYGKIGPGPILLTWLDFNPNMNKYLH